MDKQQNKDLKNLISDYVEQCVRTHKSAIYGGDEFGTNLHKKRQIRDKLVQYIDSLTVTEESTPTDDFFARYNSPWASQEHCFFPEEIRNVLAQHENERNGA